MLDILSDYSLDRLQDRAEIGDRLLRFSRGVDRKDWAMALDAYHEDGHDYHGIFDGTAADFIEFLKQRHETVLISMHHLTNVLIEFLGPDTALVETYYLGWQKLAAENRDIRTMMQGEEAVSSNPIELMANGRYLDHFERKGGRWAIQTRYVLYEAGMKIVGDAVGPDVRGTIELGRRDGLDFSFKLREQLLKRQLEV